MLARGQREGRHFSAWSMNGARGTLAMIAFDTSNGFSYAHSIGTRLAGEDSARVQQAVDRPKRLEVHVDVHSAIFDQKQQTREIDSLNVEGVTIELGQQVREPTRNQLPGGVIRPKLVFPSWMKSLPGITIPLKSWWDVARLPRLVNDLRDGSHYWRCNAEGQGMLPQLA